MMSFIPDRGVSLATVVLVMSVVAQSQASISYTIAFGALRSYMPSNASLIASVLLAMRVGFVALLVVLWILNRRHALFRVIVIVNAAFTVALVLHTGSLVGVLFGMTSHAIDALLVDVVLMVVSNILIFSIWYWIIDPPGVEEGQGGDEPWAFLFPQLAGGLPNAESWLPRYPDYLFVAFTTSFAFSPTDALPLTRRAKMLMLLQAAISVVTLTGIAGSAINILAGKS